MEVLFSVLGAFVGGIIIYIIMRQHLLKIKAADKTLKELNEEISKKEAKIELDDQKLKEWYKERKEELETKIKELQDKYNYSMELYDDSFQLRTNLQIKIAEEQSKLTALQKDYEYRIADFERQWKEQLASQRESFDALEEQDLEDYLNNRQALINMLENEKSKFQMDKAVIQSEIANMQALRQSLIDAQLREQQLQTERDFYRIALNKDDQDDIDKLLHFAKECHNQQPLRKLIWSEFFLKPFSEMANRVLGKDKMTGIYKITNIKDGKIYIGQSVDIKARWSNHIKAALGIESIAHSRIHDAMADEGIWNFTFELLEQCPKEQLNEREKYYIDFYESKAFGYNKTAGGS